MEINKVKFDTAVDDFLMGKGLGLPDPSYCEILMKYHPTINDIIMKAFNKKIEKISIMPYDNSIVTAENPCYIGPYSTCMNMENEEHKMLIYFDRN